MKLYMCVTLDDYELPLYVADSVPELAKVMGCSTNCIYPALYRVRTGKKKRSKFVEVEVEDFDL